MDEIYVEGSRETSVDDIIDNVSLGNDDDKFAFTDLETGWTSDCDPEGQIRINRRDGQRKVYLKKMSEN